MICLVGSLSIYRGRIHTNRCCRGAPARLLSASDDVFLKCGGAREMLVKNGQRHHMSKTPAHLRDLVREMN